MSAAQVWKKVETDVANAKSVRFLMNAKDGKDRIKTDLRISTSGKASGTMTMNGGKVTLRRINKVMYLKADRAFYIKSGGGAEVAKLMAGRWIQTTKGADKDMDEMFAFTYLGPTLKEVLKLSAAEKRSLRRVSGITIEGQKTIGLRNKSGDSGLLYVTATGPTLPLDISPGDDKSQYVKFRNWNEDFAVAKPADAINMDEMK